MPIVVRSQSGNEEGKAERKRLQVISYPMEKAYLLMTVFGGKPWW